jgi:hypothetical protein
MKCDDSTERAFGKRFLALFAGIETLEGIYKFSKYFEGNHTH